MIADKLGERSGMFAQVYPQNMFVMEYLLTHVTLVMPFFGVRRIYMLCEGMFGAHLPEAMWTLERLSVEVDFGVVQTVFVFPCE